MTHHNLIEVLGANMPKRCYVDGKRVSVAAFEDIRHKATMRGRLECFSTKGKQLPGGLIRRRNYSVAVLP